MMDPLSLTASLIAVIQLTGSVVSAIYNYRKGVKNAPEDAAKIIQDLTGLSHILEKLLQMIENERSTKVARLASLEGLIKPGGPLQLCQTRLEGLNAKLQPENGWRAVKQSLVWPLKQNYIKETLDDIATAKATLDLALSIDQISLALDTKDSINALTSSFESFQFDEKRKSVLSRLSPTDATINHLEACRKHQKGTGGWFTKSEQYLKWINATKSVLWINGIPGCGKTILCSTTIEDLLQNHQRNRPRIAVAYYYFNFQSKVEQQLINLLRFILLQLVCQCPNLPDAVKGMEWRLESNLSNEYLIGIIKQVFKSFYDVYLVIDAVDECEQSLEVLRWIQELAGSEDGRLHLLVSSRQDHHFRTALESITTSILTLDEHTFEKDIQLYIREQLSTDPRMMRWPLDIQNDIEQSLIANAGGLFRWVDCQLDVLRKCLRVNNIKGVLGTPPKTLNETYNRIIGSIDEAYIEDACKILQWLVFSARPLRTNELNDILAFDRSDPQNPIFRTSLRLPLLEDVLTLCSSLLIVSEKKSTGQDDSNIESLEVRLAHNSVKDYLISRHIKSGPYVWFALEKELGHSVIAGCCLVYLLQFRSRLDVAMLQEFPLAPYAAQFWTEHYRLSGGSDSHLLDRLALRLLTSKKSYRNCCCLYNPDKRWQSIELEKDPRLPPLYYASLTSLSHMMLPLVTNGADPNKGADGGHHGEALGAAAYKGDVDTVKALLSAGAKPDEGYWEGVYGFPIASAASQGNNTIVALLLQAGADVNKRGQTGEGSALYQAVSNRRLETLKMLLDVGADANAFEGMSGVVFAIELAASRDDRESVCLLFSKVSDWMAERTLGEIAHKGYRELFETLLQTPRGREMGLQHAARAGWDDIVQSMIDEKLPVANNDSSTVVAFCQAAASGSLDTTQILYENTEENTVTADELSEAVASAAIGGYRLVVKYLLDRGADPGSQKCQKALVQAAEKGHLSTVQELLTAGVSPHSHYEVSWRKQGERSCLWAAVNDGHVEIARRLLALGADPNTHYGGISVLNLSIEKGNEKLFDLLLEKGASIATIQLKNAQYDTLALPIPAAIGQTQKIQYDTLALPNHYAASTGNIHILRRLLDAGLEADSRLITDGWTALFHAAKAGHEQVLRILINDYRADFNRSANKGTVAIHTAAYHNHSKCFEVFLDAGVDVNVQGRLGRTPLHWATQQGSIDAVQVLLERGANVFVEEKDTLMKATDIAKLAALEVSESRKSEYHWKRPREENYEPILKMLEEAAAESSSIEHGSNICRKLPSVVRKMRRKERPKSPP